EEHLAALQEFLQQAREATEPAEVLWRLCAFCTERAGLSVAEAYLVCSRDPARLHRVGPSGESIVPIESVAASRLEELLAGYRSVLLLKRPPGRRCPPAGARAAGGGDGNGSSGEHRVPSALLPIRSADRTLGLLVL